MVLFEVLGFAAEYAARLMLSEDDVLTFSEDFETIAFLDIEVFRGVRQAIQSCRGRQRVL